MPVRFDSVSLGQMIETRTSRSSGTNEECLALLLASTRARRQSERERLVALVARVDPEALSFTLNGYRILSLGIARLEEAGVQELADTLRAANRLRLRLTKIRSFGQEAFTEALLSLLEEHGIPAVPLKGVTLARRVFGDPALQESNDVDILVLPEQLDAAVELLRGRYGFDEPVDLRDREGRPLLHFRLEQAQGASPVELHWRVHWYETRSGATMLRRAIREGATRRLTSTDEFASLLLFYARDGFTGVRALASIASWWDRYGDDSLPAQLSAFVAEFPELGAALTQSAEIASDLSGIPRLAGLVSVNGSSWRPHSQARRLVNWRLGQSEEQTSAEVALVDVLLAPPGAKWQSLRRQVFISRGQAAHRQQQPQPPPEWRVTSSSFATPPRSSDAS